jgi:hypothetical protein
MRLAGGKFMKLSNLTSMLAGMRSKAARMLGVAALAGAALAVAVPTAQAQRVFVRVGPRYVAPAPPVVYVDPGFYYGPRYRAWVPAHRSYRHY